MGIDIDTERCIGAAACVRHAPEVFTQDEDGLAALRPGGGDGEDDPLTEEAARGCPVQAITLGGP